MKTARLGPRPIPVDRIAEIRRCLADIQAEGWIRLDLDIWYPDTPGSPLRQQCAGRSETLPVALSAEGARALGEQLLACADFLEGSGRAN